MYMSHAQVKCIYIYIHMYMYVASARDAGISNIHSTKTHSYSTKENKIKKLQVMQ